MYGEGEKHKGERTIKQNKVIMRENKYRIRKKTEK